MAEAGRRTQEADIVIVGAGPSGIFTALALAEAGARKRIVLVDEGLSVEERRCPKAVTGRCMGCEPCRITTGFSGAGAFSDGKLSLSAEVGGDLPDLIGYDEAQRAIREVDGIYLSFAIRAGLKPVDCPIRHLGTERAQAIYARIEARLREVGVDLHLRTACRDIVVEGGRCAGVVLEGPDGAAELRAERVVIAAGRRGADWLEKLCDAHGIRHEPGVVDIGVRVELRNEIMERVNNVLYESKLIGYPNPFRDKVRTFCQNPGGFVSQENYAGGLAVVNGHSYKNRKSANTNLAILCSHRFTEPFDQPIAYARKIGELANMLGAGRLLVQRFGDIQDGKRTWAHELERSNVRPTLPDAVAGDVTNALPYRTMTSIINFMLAVDEAIPGFAAGETLLYAPELKFYSNRVALGAGFECSLPGLHCLGDASGWTRGLMMASVMGHLMGKWLAER